MAKIAQKLKLIQNLVRKLKTFSYRVIHLNVNRLVNNNFFVAKTIVGTSFI